MASASNVHVQGVSKYGNRWRFYITFRSSLISFLEAAILLVSTKDPSQGSAGCSATWIRTTEALRKAMANDLINERKNELLYVDVN